MWMVALKPQDVLVLLKLAVLGGAPWKYSTIAASLGMSPSEAHAAAKRLRQLKLLDAQNKPLRRALLEFLVHGVKYVFAVERGAMTRGMPTAHAAPPLMHDIAAGDDPPPVWPDPEGPVRGEAFTPLYPSVVHAARQDPQLYQCLALVDAIRGGRARERHLAEQHLRAVLDK